MKTDFGEALYRAYSPLDQRSPTPKLKWGACDAVSQGTRQPVSSRTPTPHQWAREQATLRSQTPTNCMSTLASLAALDNHSGRRSAELEKSWMPEQEPRAATALGIHQRVPSALGGSSVGAQTARAATPEQQDFAGSWTARSPTPEPPVGRRSSSKTGNRPISGVRFSVLMENHSLEVQRAIAPHTSREEAASYEELYRKPRPHSRAVDDHRPQRSQPLPPLPVAKELASRGLAATDPGAGAAAPNYGGMPRRVRRPMTLPSQMSAPCVRPHNGWCTFVDWVPPADYDGHPDYKYELEFRTEGSEQGTQFPDIGPEPYMQFFGLAAGHSYYFRVRGQNEIGDGPWSYWSPPYTVPEPTPGQRKTGRTRTLSATRRPKSARRQRKAQQRQPTSVSHSPTSIDLDWEEPCSHGAHVIGYRVQYGTDPDDPDTIETATVLHRRTSMTVENLIPNTLYHFRVSAVNEEGESPWTDWSDPVATAATEPDAPRAPRLAEAYCRDLVICWEQPHTCGFEVSNYDIRIACEDPTMGTASVIRGPEHAGRDGRLHLRDLQPLTAYFFQVRAETVIGVSEWSDISEPIMTLMTWPEACGSLEVAPVKAGTVSAEWVAPESHRLPITAFTLQWSRDARMRTVLGQTEVPGSATTFKGTPMRCEVKDLELGARLYFHVAAITEAGRGPFSPPTGEMIVRAARPEKPDPPTCVTRTATSLLLRVEDTVQDNGSPVVRYELRLDNNVLMQNPVVVTTSMHLVSSPHGSQPRRFEYPATKLNRHGPYHFSVRAVNEEGPSLWSHPSVAQELRYEAPTQMAAPKFVRAEEGGCLVVRYVPSAELGASMKGGLWEYEMRWTRWPELLRDEANIGELVQINNTVYHSSRPASSSKVQSHRWRAEHHLDPPPVRASDLHKGRRYYFQIRATSTLGIAPWSDVSHAMETLPTIPERPAPITFVKGTEHRYTVTVQMMLPEPNGRPVTSVRLRYLGPNWKDAPPATEWQYVPSRLDDKFDCEVLRQPWPREQAEAASEPFQTIWRYDVMKMRPGANYVFQFCCTNEVGESEWSEPSEFIPTLPNVPDRCREPVLASEAHCTESSLTLTWEPPHNGGSDITHYTLQWCNNPRFDGYQTIDDIVGTSYTLTDLFNNQWYYMKLAATNACGQGKFSDYDPQSGAGCFHTHPTTPGPPLNLSLKPVVDVPGAVYLMWDKPATNGGCLVMKYRIVYSESESLDNHVELITKAFRECKITAMKPDTTYYFDIYAANCMGFGPRTGAPVPVRTNPVPAISSVVPKAPKAPHLEYFSGEGRGFQVSWICPETFDPDHGFIYDEKDQTHPIRSYSVQLCGGLPDPALRADLKEIEDVRQRRGGCGVPLSDTNRAFFEKVIPGHYYAAQVRSKSEAGISDWSEASEVLRVPPEPPIMVQDLACVGRTHSSLTLEWTPPFDSGEPIQGFSIEVAARRVLRGWNGGAPAAGLFDHRDLTGQYEEIIDERSQQHTLEVAAADCEHGSTCRWEVPGLEPASSYALRIRAWNVVGRGPQSPGLELKTHSVPPGPPSHAMGMPGEATNSSVTFCWNKPVYDGGEEVLGYELRWAELLLQDPVPEELGDGQDVRSVELGPDVGTYRVEGIQPGNKLVPVIRARNRVGYGLPSRLPQEGPEIDALYALPLVPQKIFIPPVIERAASTDHRPFSWVAHWTCPVLRGRLIESFTLRFTRADGEGGGPGAAGRDACEIQVYNTTGAEWREGDQVSYVDVHNALEPAARYVLHVRAASAIGPAEEWSDASGPEVTPPDYPLQPAPPTSTWQWPRSIEIEWVLPHMRGAPADDCMVRFAKTPDMAPGEEVSIPFAEQGESQATLIPNLVLSTAYHFQVRVRNVAGWSDWSPPSQAIHTRPTRPMKPDVPELVEVTAESVCVRWEPPDNHGAELTEYEIILVDDVRASQLKHFVDEANSGNPEEAQCPVIEGIPPFVHKTLAVDGLADAAAPDHFFAGLLGGIDFAVSVRVRNFVGFSDWSVPLERIRTPDAPPCQCPLPHLVEASPRSLRCECELPYDNGDRVTSVDFVWARVAGPLDRHLALGGRAAPGLAAGERPAIATSGVVTVELPAPGPERARPYHTGGKYEATIEGLEPGTEYDVRTCAKNSLGEGSCSQEVRMMCKAGKPDAPSGVRHSASKPVKPTGATTLPPPSTPAHAIAAAAHTRALRGLGEERRGHRRSADAVPS